MRRKGLEAIRGKVEQMRDRLGKPVDKKVKKLVVGLNYCGIPTVASCEGHLDHGLPYPWVDVSYEYAEKLARVASWQNRPRLPNGRWNENTWVIRPGTFLRLMPENRNLPLKKLQEQANRFGLFLQKLPANWFPDGWFEKEKRK